MPKRHDKFLQPADAIFVVRAVPSKSPKLVSPASKEIAFRELVKPLPTRPPDLEEVRQLAAQLRAFLNHPSTQQQLEERHVVGTSSAVIQSLMLEEATRLGFQSERKGLFASYASCGIRPDYFRPIGQSGILMEVERGKTIANNMDLLDLWKCHLCREADYLFLVIPQRRPTARGFSEAMFTRVSNRLQTFFQPDNFVNVEAVFLFGY